MRLFWRSGGRDDYGRLVYSSVDRICGGGVTGLDGASVMRCFWRFLVLWFLFVSSAFGAAECIGSYKDEASASAAGVAYRSAQGSGPVQCDYSNGFGVCGTPYMCYSQIAYSSDYAVFGFFGGQCPSDTEPDATGKCVPLCPEGETRNEEGICENECAPLAGTVVGSAGSYYPASSCSGSVAIGPCMATSSGCTAIGVGDSKEYYAEGPFILTGAAASEAQQGSEGLQGSSGGGGAPPAPGAPAPPSASECLDAGYGFISVNGSVTCTEPSPDVPVERTYTSTTTTTGPDNVPVTTTTTTTITDTGPSQTTTSVLNGPAGPTTTTTTSDSDAPPGDGEGAKLGTPTDGYALKTKDVGAGIFTPVTLPGVSECPAAIPLPLGMEFSFSGICQMASGIRFVVVAMAWIFAALLLAGALKEG